MPYWHTTGALDNFSKSPRRLATSIRAHNDAHKAIIEMSNTTGRSRNIDFILVASMNNHPFIFNGYLTLNTLLSLVLNLSNMSSYLRCSPCHFSSTFFGGGVL